MSSINYSTAIKPDHLKFHWYGPAKSTEKVNAYNEPGDITKVSTVKKVLESQNSYTYSYIKECINITKLYTKSIDAYDATICALICILI